MGCAAHKANTNAVKDHPLASVTDDLGQVLRSDCVDEGGKAAGHGLLWGTPGHHVSSSFMHLPGACQEPLGFLQS